MAFHECDAPVTEGVQVAECQMGGARVIQQHIDNPFYFAVRRDSDYGEWELPGKLCIDKEKSVDGAVAQKMRIFVLKIGPSKVADGEVMESLL